MSLSVEHAGDGFTLVEVLVAATVLSFGLLGIATMHVRALQASQAASMRAQAVTLAADLADRMRANRSPAGNYAGGGLDSRAEADLATWQSFVAATLPEGTGRVTYRPPSGAAPGQYQIEIAWQQAGSESPIVCTLQLEL